MAGPGIVVPSWPGNAPLLAWLGSVSLAALTAPGVALAQDDTSLPEIRVIAPGPVTTPRSRPVRVPVRPPAVRTPAPPPTPTPAPDPTVIDRDKIPSNTQTLTADDFQRTYTQSVTDT